MGAAIFLMETIKKNRTILFVVVLAFGIFSVVPENFLTMKTSVALAQEEKTESKEKQQDKV